MIKSAGGILIKKISSVDHVLIVHRTRYNDWSLPKGKCYEGESFEQTAIREVKEETNIDAEIVSEIKTIKYIAKGEEKITVYFRMNIVNENEFKPNDETDVIRWVSLDEAAELLSYNELKSLINSIKNKK